MISSLVASPQSSYSGRQMEDDPVEVVRRLADDLTLTAQNSNSVSLPFKSILLLGQSPDQDTPGVGRSKPRLRGAVG